MSARAEVVRTRRWLRALFIVRALAWGAAATRATMAMMDAVGGAGTPLVAALVGAGVAVVVALRTRWPVEDWRVALWIEERVPGLRFTLVSAADPACASRWPELERTLPSIPWGSLRRASAWRVLRVPAVMLLASAIGVRLVPIARTAGLVPGVDVRPGAGGTGRLLGSLRLTVTEPAYAGGVRRVLEDPQDVAALAGSNVELAVDAASAPVASLGDSAVAVQRHRGAWTARFRLPDRPTVLRLVAGKASRIVTLSPRPDSAPALVFRTPSADTTLRMPVGRIALTASAHDDIGIVLAGFEYIVSSGSGESFTFRSGTLGLARLARAKEADLHAILDVATLGLGPGDVVHLRAVASDGLTPPAPDSARAWRGTSQTRVVRVARAGEYDSVAVEGAAPPEVEGAISQRMLLQLTEELQKRQARLSPATVRVEARRIAVDQIRLRKRVGAIIFARLGGGGSGEEAEGGADERLDGRLDPESLLARASEATNITGAELQEQEGEDAPVIAINRPLLEAYNHMWDAQRGLEVTTLPAAIRAMHRAIAALQKARAAERVYLRGRPPTVVVDVSRVRLTGKGAPVALAARVPRPGVEGARRALGRRLRSVGMIARRDAIAAADSLLLLRVASLTDAPDAAAALGDAADALRRGRDPGAALARARRQLAGAPRAQGLGRWTGWLP